MQFDHNRIVIRERNYLDVLDLALGVIRAHAGPLAVAFACAAVPVACLNAWLLADYREHDFEAGFPFTYVWLMFLLIVVEAPLVTAPLTLYLGEALFTERPRPGEIVRRFFRSLPQLVFFQVFLRSLAVVVAFSWLWPAASPGAFVGVSSVVLFVVWSVFLIGWPYLGEVVLLERNPMRGKSPEQMTTNRRRRLLHAGFGGDLLLRWFATLGIGAILVASTWGSLWLADLVLLNDQSPFGPPCTVCFPLALWLVVGYSAVVRFLGYLDLRIRREGWDVELMIRAEQARLKRHLV